MSNGWNAKISKHFVARKNGKTCCHMSCCPECRCLYNYGEIIKILIVYNECVYVLIYSCNYVCVFNCTAHSRGSVSPLTCTWLTKVIIRARSTNSCRLIEQQRTAVARQKQKIQNANTRYYCIKKNLKKKIWKNVVIEGNTCYYQNEA